MNKGNPFICFQSVNYNSISDYILKKIQTVRSEAISKSKLDQWIKLKSDELKNSDESIVPIEIILPEKTNTPGIAKNIENDFRNQVNTYFPLIEGEEIQKQYLGYLSDTYEAIPRNSIVLVIESNYAVYFFLNDINKVLNTKQGLIIQPSSSNDDQGNLNNIEDLDIGELAKEFSLGLIGKAPFPFDVIATWLIGSIWKNNSDAEESWQKVYDNLQKIVKTNLAEQDVKNAIKTLKGFLSFLRNEYAPMRDNDKFTKAQRLNALEPYDHDFFVTIVENFRRNTSNPDEIEKKMVATTLSNFLLGANTHLALIQERALQDETGVFKTTIKNLAKDYAEYPMKTKNIIIKRRIGMVGEIYSDYDWHWVYVDRYYYYKDNGNDKKYKFYYGGGISYVEALQEAHNSRGGYIQGLGRNIEKLFNDQVLPVVENWKKLIEDPLPDVK